MSGHRGSMGGERHEFLVDFVIFDSKLSQVVKHHICTVPVAIACPSFLVRIAVYWERLHSVYIKHNNIIYVNSMNK